MERGLSSLEAVDVEDRESGEEAVVGGGGEGLGRKREADAMADLRAKDAADLAERLEVETRLRRAAEERCGALEVEARVLWEETRFLQQRLAEAREEAERTAKETETRMRVREEDGIILHRALERGYAEAVSESVRRALEAQANHRGAKSATDVATLVERNDALVRMLEALADRLEVSERLRREAEREKELLEAESALLTARGGNQRYLARLRAQRASQPALAVPDSAPPAPPAPTPPAAAAPVELQPPATAAARTAGIVRGAEALLQSAPPGDKGLDSEHWEPADSSLLVEDRSRTGGPRAKLSWVKEARPPRPGSAKAATSAHAGATAVSAASPASPGEDGLSLRLPHFSPTSHNDTFRSTPLRADRTSSPPPSSFPSPTHRRSPHPAISPLAKSLRESRGSAPFLASAAAAASSSAPSRSLDSPPPPPPPQRQVRQVVALTLDWAEHQGRPASPAHSPSSTAAWGSSSGARRSVATTATATAAAAAILPSAVAPSSSPVHGASMVLRGHGFLTSVPHGTVSPS
jgi:hypothetical protein